MKKTIDEFNRRSAISITLRLALNDFKFKYTGSVFGIIWAAAEPIVTVLLYRFVYTVAIGGEWIDGCPYYLWLSIGVAVWFLISDGLRSVTSCFRDYSYLVKKMQFKKEILPAVRTLSALISSILFFVLVITACAVEGVVTYGTVYLPLWIAAAAVFVFSLGRIFAFICAKFKDMQNIVGIGLSIGFWLTPIFWKLPSDGPIKLLSLNPAAKIVDGCRNSILYSSFSAVDFIYILAVCVVLAVVGSIMENLILPNIADKL